MLMDAVDMAREFLPALRPAVSLKLDGRPGEARNADPGSAVGAAEEEGKKAACWMSRVSCDGRCISNVGEGLGM